MDDNKNVRNTRQSQSTLTHVQIDEIQNNITQLYGVVAITTCVLNNEHTLDDIHTNELKERYNESLNKLKSTHEQNLFVAIFSTIQLSCISVSIPDYNNTAIDNNLQLYQQQQQYIYEQLVSYQSLHILISYLKLFTTVSLDKLSVFLNTSIDDVQSQLLKLKLKYTLYKHQSMTPISHGKYIDICDVQYTLNNNIVYIHEQIQERRYSDWFLKSTSKLHDINRELARIGKTL